MAASMEARRGKGYRRVSLDYEPVRSDQHPYDRRRIPAFAPFPSSARIRTQAASKQEASRAERSSMGARSRSAPASRQRQNEVDALSQSRLRRAKDSDAAGIGAISSASGRPDNAGAPVKERKSKPAVRRSRGSRALMSAGNRRGM